ncbi:MAG: YraN family protein [Candidatus Abyssubacteria bacterium]
MNTWARLVRGLLERTIRFRSPARQDATTSDRGARGEEHAVRALKKQRYRILDRNFRTPVGEIDIIAQEGPCLVFVEVRTRASIHYGLPQETVIERKQRRLSKAAKWYLQRNRLDNSQCRFDVVAIVMDNGEHPHIEVIRDAFRPKDSW